MNDEYVESLWRALCEHPPWPTLFKDIADHPFQILIDRGEYEQRRSVKYNLLRFCRYQQNISEDWFDPHLDAYRDYLLETEGRPTSTTSTYLSAVRSAYRSLARAEWFRTLLHALIPNSYSHVDKQRHVEDFCRTLECKVNASWSRVRHPALDPVQDLLKDALFLTPSQVNQLLSAPPSDTLKGIRDRAIIATLLCTGVRIKELVNLQAHDILPDASVQVRHGDQIDRVIPFGALDWGLALLKTWMRAAGIYVGPIFLQLARNERFCCDASGYPQALSEPSVGCILRSYPIWIDEERVTVSPRQVRVWLHALRSRRARCSDSKTIGIFSAPRYTNSVSKPSSARTSCAPAQSLFVKPSHFIRWRQLTNHSIFNRALLL